MKPIQILLLFVMVVALSNPVSAWGFEVFGQKIGVQEYKALGDKDNRGFTTGNIAIESDMTMDTVDWYVDGQLDSIVKKVKKASFNLISISRKDAKGNIVGYKAGKDKTTKRQIHKIVAKTSGGEQTWFVLS